MLYIIEEAKIRLENQTKAAGLTTGKVRSISSSLYKEVTDKSIDNIFYICKQLLEERKWEFGVIAYDWAFRVRNQYNNYTFSIFESWLKEYVTGWGDCDDFCTHAVGELVCQNNDLYKNIIRWTEHPNYCIRRASAVSLIYPIRKNKFDNIDPFLVSDILMNDEHYLVLKGYGWMLKVLSQVEPDRVSNYLMENRERIPKVAFRYAIEKFDKETKTHLIGC
ncbi:MAG: DNA alkylation repair protein [Exilispira sp.]|mgnify:FL=1|nr:DNA alkylation repair protein [Exilispira sp.]